MLYYKKCTKDAQRLEHQGRMRRPGLEFAIMLYDPCKVNK